MFTVLFIIGRKYISFQIAYDLNNNKTGLQPVSMTCGIGSLFWRVGRGTDRSIILEGGYGGQVHYFGEWLEGA